MAVFVSYARADEPYAERLAEALRAKGYELWRDDELPAHRAYAEVIQERLDSAEAVIVLWSASSSTSQWVKRCITAGAAAPSKTRERNERLSCRMQASRLVRAR